MGYTSMILYTNILLQKTDVMASDQFFLWIHRYQVLLVSLFLWLSLLLVFRIIYLRFERETQLKITEQSVYLKSKLDPLQDLIDRLTDKKAKEVTKKLTSHQVPNTLQVNLIKKLREFEADKTFVNPALLLDQLAKQMGTNSRYLSIVIREVYDKNFTEYINELRVKEVLNMFEQGMQDKMTLEGLSQLAGFNSRVTFNRAFKKYTGKTPSLYLEEINCVA